MDEKSSYLVYFATEKMQQGYESFREERQELLACILVMLELRERYMAGQISIEFTIRDYRLMKLHLKMRRSASKSSFYMRMKEVFNLEEAELMILMLALVKDSDRLSGVQISRLCGRERMQQMNLYAADRLLDFECILEDGNINPAYDNEKLALFLDNGIEASMDKYAEIFPRKALLRYIELEDKAFLGKPYGMTGSYSRRIITSDELPELVLYENILEQVCRMNLQNREPWILKLIGDEGVGRTLLSSYLARQLGKNLLIVEGKKLDIFKHEQAVSIAGKQASEWFYEWQLEAMLSSDLIMLKDLSEADSIMFIDRINSFFIISKTMENPGAEDGSENEYQSIRNQVAVNMLPPDASQRDRLWRYFLNNSKVGEDVSIAELSSKYFLNAKGIKDIIFSARMLMLSRNEDALTMEDISKAVTMGQYKGLGPFARKIAAGFSWEDLVVDDETKTQLEYICAQVKYRQLVGEEWGFYEKLPYGRGVSALFYGPPGTGKTMAAQVIARELGFDLYRVDLSQMSSKYIGETEKNISALFERARQMNIILFFDEADSFFAKRQEAKDSHDVNANAKVGHLLQQLEDYDGIVLLATNLKEQIDDAFKRRIKYMISFSFPDAQTRKKLWKSLLPDRLPHESSLDIDFFAERFELSGSQIKDVLLQAAFIAANGNEVLGNRHVKEALKMNYRKYGKLLTDLDFGYMA